MSATLIADLKRQLAAERDHGKRLQMQLDAILITDKLATPPSSERAVALLRELWSNFPLTYGYNERQRQLREQVKSFLATLPQSDSAALLSHECGPNMACRICGALPLAETPPQPASETWMTPRMDATLSKGADWVFAEGCKLERELNALRADGGTAKVPDGMVLVPVNATEQMVSDGEMSYLTQAYPDETNFASNRWWRGALANVYRAMLAAAPSPDSQQDKN